MGFVYDYKKHLEDVQRDRSLEQMLQSEDCFLTNNTPVLLVQTDGMDQAKWSVPRLWDRPSKEMGSVVRTGPELFYFQCVLVQLVSNSIHQIVRPRMKVQGVWIQSVCLQLYVADVHLAHDSSMTVEVTCPMNQDFMPFRTNCVADSRLDLEKVSLIYQFRFLPDHWRNAIRYCNHMANVCQRRCWCGCLVCILVDMSIRATSDRLLASKVQRLITPHERTRTAPC